MKTAINSIFLFAFVAVMSACNNSQPKENHDGHDHSKETTVPLTKTAMSLKDDKLNGVYQHYTHLTSALTNGNTDEAKVAASAMELGAKQIQGAENIAASASKITASGDLEVQRTTFAVLSSDLIEMVKKTGLNSGELYVAHCPMALNDRGADWVSSSKEIKNPYYGESMLSCGSVKETLK